MIERFHESGNGMQHLWFGIPRKRGVKNGASDVQDKLQVACMVHGNCHPTASRESLSRWSVQR